MPIHLLKISSQIGDEFYYRVVDTRSLREIGDRSLCKTVFSSLIVQSLYKQYMHGFVKVDTVYNVGIEPISLDHANPNCVKEQ